METREKIGAILAFVGLLLSFYFIGIPFLCIGAYLLMSRPKDPGWKQDAELVIKRSKTLQKAGVAMLIIGLIMILLSIWGASLIKWSWSIGWGFGMLFVVMFISLGGILMIIGLIYLIFIGPIRKETLLKKIEIERPP